MDCKAKSFYFHAHCYMGLIQILIMYYQYSYIYLQNHNRELWVCPLAKQHLSSPENIALRPQMLSLQHTCNLLIVILLLTVVFIRSLSITLRLQTYQIFEKLKEQLEPLNSGTADGLHQSNGKIYIKCIKLAKYFFRSIKRKFLGWKYNIHFQVSSTEITNWHCNYNCSLWTRPVVLALLFVFVRIPEFQANGPDCTCHHVQLPVC